MDTLAAEKVAESLVKNEAQHSEEEEDTESYAQE